MRAAVPPDERLVVTLRFLATGRSLQDLHFSAAVSRSLLSVIIPETCNAIVRSLRSDNQFPKTVEAWNKIAKDFEQLWQFPNCGGALDGKHVRITQPRNSGSYFYNYKGYFSLIMMALVNANYEFINVDVGMNGRVSDGGVLEHTAFGEHLQNGALHLPTNSETTGNLNFVFVGDEAFPLHANLLKPFPQNALTQERRIFNYRLSRACRWQKATSTKMGSPRDSPARDTSPSRDAGRKDSSDTRSSTGRKRTEDSASSKDRTNRSSPPPKPVSVLFLVWGPKKSTAKTNNKECPLCACPLPKDYIQKLCRSCIQAIRGEASASTNPPPDLRELIRTEIQASLQSLHGSKKSKKSHRQHDSPPI
ncbi:uncharacterized protein ACNLHF_000061 [Anomaloglossus baeobatrachus]